MYIGVDLGGTKTECILLDNSGREIERLRKKTPKNYNGTIENICELINSIEGSEALWILSDKLNDFIVKKTDNMPFFN